MNSIWQTTTDFPRGRSLPEDQTTDVAIIGGGMAGILTAWFLKKRGIKATVLEAKSIGSGQTGRTTAKITAQHGAIYHTLIKTFGEKKALEYAQSNSDAITAYAKLIQEEQIDCHFEFQPSYLYSMTDIQELKQEVTACNDLGLPAQFTTESALPFSISGAAVLPKQAQFHPLDFLSALVKQIDVFENTPVVEVVENQVRTDCGTVTAQNIVFTAHYPFLNLPGLYFMRMHQERSYVIALEGAAKLNGMYFGIDPDGLSFRNFGNYLLLGGGKHRTGENPKGGRYEMLRQTARQFWPNCREVASWSAQDCMTLDGVPYIGQFSSSTPNWYVATGFGKWGMTHSMIAAKRICQLIAGEKTVGDSIFSPSRFTPSASAKSFLKDGLHAVQDLSRQILAPPREKFSSIPNGHGGIVEYHGKKTGVYKDLNGELFVVSTRCPHLGCQLEWNPDEKSWDCPCHGSRFDYRGNRLDNPAQENLISER